MRRSWWALRGLDSPLRTGSSGKFIFVHINKTAGTSVARAIGLPSRRHLTVREIIDLIGTDSYNNAFTFTVVRNPWDKVLSHYTFRMRTGQTGLDEQPIPFEQWISATYGPDRDASLYDKPKLFQPQVEWLKDETGQINVDRVLRFEDLEGGFTEVAGTIGVDPSLPQLNSSERRNYRDYYTDESAAIIEESFAADLDLFGYRFD